MSAILRSALVIMILVSAGCAAANGPAPQSRPYVQPMGGNDGGGGGGSGGGMGM